MGISLGSLDLSFLFCLGTLLEWVSLSLNWISASKIANFASVCLSVSLVQCCVRTNVANRIHIGAFCRLKYSWMSTVKKSHAATAIERRHRDVGQNKFSFRLQGFKRSETSTKDESPIVFTRRGVADTRIFCFYNSGVASVPGLGMHIDIFE